MCHFFRCIVRYVLTFAATSVSAVIVIVIVRYIVTFAATSVPAGWSFSTDVEVSVHPKNFQKNEIGRMDLKVR